MESAPTLPLLLRKRVQAHPQLPAQFSKDAKGVFQPTSFGRFYDEVRAIAAGLLELGARRGEHIGLISDNRKEWLISDFAVLSIGAADVPRGCDSTAREIAYILGFSDCRFSFAENARQLDKILSLRDEMPLLATVILYDRFTDEQVAAAAGRGIRLVSFPDLMALGEKRREQKPDEVDTEIDKGNTDDLATIIFTSGTTGEPKGVMISHGNLLHQLPSLPGIVNVQPGDIWLSVLPVWHSFERIMEYSAPYLSSAIAYSKPIGAVMLADFAAIRPQWMASVPRIWESVRDGIYRSMKQAGGATKALFDFFVAVGKQHTKFRNLVVGLAPDFTGRIRALDVAIGIVPFLLLSPIKALGDKLVFSKIRAKLGGRFQAGISGGGALPPHVDGFFSAVGVLLLEGYGLTEAAPVLACRRWAKPRPGCVGLLMLDTEVKVVDDNGRELPPGRQGLILARGGQVMQGYYKKEEETRRVISSDGWLNTGDLGMMTRDGEIKITGRAKDTIVLRGGENVEPYPIEAKIRESDWIAQCMVVGQDQKYLGALVIPKEDAVVGFAKDNGIPFDDYASLLSQSEVQELIMDEVESLVSPHTGFKPFERVFRIKLLARDFETGVELSAKQELMRHKINKLYEKEVASLFN